jgi:hypothetical protein
VARVDFAKAAPDDIAALDIGGVDITGPGCRPFETGRRVFGGRRLRALWGFARRVEAAVDWPSGFAAASSSPLAGSRPATAARAQISASLRKSCDNPASSGRAG